MQDIEKAKLAENRGDFNEAMNCYKDAVFRIKNLAPTDDHHKRNFRQTKVKEIQDSINRLESMT